jgi:hypothetical protein
MPGFTSISLEQRTSHKEIDNSIFLEQRCELRILLLLIYMWIAKLI